MPFRRGNQEWRKRRGNRGGRPTKQQKELKELRLLMRLNCPLEDCQMMGLLGLLRTTLGTR
jgi:hypothetical protein